MTRLDLVEQLIENLHVINRHLGLHKEGAMWSCTLNRSQVRVLYLVYGSGEVTVTHLAAKANTTVGAVTQIVDGLIEKGYLERARSKKDRRIVQIRFSDEGRIKFAELKKTHVKYISQLFDVLNDEELQSMVDIQNKMINKLQV